MPDNSSKDAFNQSVTNPDGSPLCDKDNAAPVLKPSFAQKPAPNLAPAGMMGIRTGLKQPSERTPEPSKQSGVAFNERDNDTSLWTDGRIITMEGYTFTAKVHDEPSQFGIDGGKISKLQVCKDGEQVMNYDRGWDDDPKTAEHREALHRIRNGLDDTPAKEFKGFERDQGKDHGFER
ncbi:MAG: hypothetical protein ABJN34_14890 [Litoreibacter sp.]|uniref:DUF7678 domain-containing protein n=1 Tax=Litoreibacter sp. TaxID=1969459 RepID=UPI0032983975